MKYFYLFLFANYLFSNYLFAVHPPEIDNILNKYCIDCHGADKQKGKVRFDTLSMDLSNIATANIWQKTLDVVNVEEMPPEDEKQLSKEEFQTLTDYINRKIDEEKDNKNTVNKLNVRRLTNLEYQYTMTDLFQQAYKYSHNLPRDIESEHGFFNDSSTMVMTPAHFNIYWNNSRNMIAQIIKQYKKTPPISYNVENHTYDIKYDKNKINQFNIPIKKLDRNGTYTLTINTKDTLKDARLFLIEKSNKIKEQSFIRKITTSTNPTTITIKLSDINLRNSYQKEQQQFSIFSKGKINSVAVTIRSSKTFDNLFKPKLYKKLSEKDYVKTITKNFMQRAYRRQISTTELNDMMAYYTKHRKSFKSLNSFLQEMLAIILLSPDFLYKMERRNTATKAEKVNSFELASRMSYFLWSSMPDDELFKFASNNTLQEEKHLITQIDRMLTDNKINRFLEGFCSQWLKLDQVKGVAIDPSYYPKFNTKLQKYMIEETQLFFNEIFLEDLSIINFIKSNFTISRKELALHYGIVPPKYVNSPNNKILKITFPDNSERSGGLLSQGSFLVANSTGADSHAIKRGVWILTNILNDPPSEPPANVSLNTEAIPNFDKLSTRQKLEVHRIERKNCYSCHKDIDPLGIAFEGFDAVGSPRSRVKHFNKEKEMFFTKVDNKVQMEDGTILQGVKSVQDYILNNKKEDFTKGFTEKMLIYALGREIRLNEHKYVDEIHESFKQSNYKIKHLVKTIILSDIFKTK